MKNSTELKDDEYMCTLCINWQPGVIIITACCRAARAWCLVPSWRTTVTPVSWARTPSLPPGLAARLLQYRNSEYAMPW